MSKPVLTGLDGYARAKKMPAYDAGLVMILVSASFGASKAHATEGGGTAYPVGVNNVLAGILPPPGETRLYDYAEEYSADRSNDGEGHSHVPGFNLNLKVNAFRFLHTWDTQVGPFSLTSGIVLPIADVTAKVGGRRQEIFGLGDVGLQLSLFGWHNDARNFFVNFGPNVGVRPCGWTGCGVRPCGWTGWAI